MASNVSNWICERERKSIVPHPELSHHLVKKTFEAYATGNFTLREVRDKFNALGLKRKSGRELAGVELSKTSQKSYLHGTNEV